MQHRGSHSISQLKFGTASASDQQLDITLDNLTTIHIQGMILRKADAFYIVNNGEHAFRVNDALLHPNEAGSLGTRAILSVRLSDTDLPSDCFIYTRFSSIPWSFKHWNCLNDIDSLSLCVFKFL